MTEYYFDIETSELDPWKNQVIAVAYQLVSRNLPSGDLIILRAWESGGERGILSKVMKLGLFDIDGGKSFNFIPVGTNLFFDLVFLFVRTQKLGLKRWTTKRILQFLQEKPMKDIKTALVAMNDGSFKGSGLDDFTTKKRVDGAVVPRLWAKRDFEGIDRYIHEDARAFFDVYGKITATLRDLGDETRANR